MLLIELVSGPNELHGRFVIGLLDYWLVELGLVVQYLTILMVLVDAS